MRKGLCTLLALGMLGAAMAQFGASPRQQEATRDDHAHLLRLLKIETLRPGPSGNPSAPNAANADEQWPPDPDPARLEETPRGASGKIRPGALWARPPAHSESDLGGDGDP